YTLTAESGSPVPEVSTSSFTGTQKNDTNVLIRLENINPYAFKCSVSTSTADFKETAIASFLGIIGGVANVGASTSNVTPGKTTAIDGTQKFMAFPLTGPTTGVPTNACEHQYLSSPAHSEAQYLQTLRDLINAALDKTQTG